MSELVQGILLLERTNRELQTRLDELSDLSSIKKEIDYLREEQKRLIQELSEKDKTICELNGLIVEKEDRVKRLRATLISHRTDNYVDMKRVLAKYSRWDVPKRRQLGKRISQLTKANSELLKGIVHSDYIVVTRGTILRWHNSIPEESPERLMKIKKEIGNQLKYEK